ncbi:MAG: alternative ribosome rescue aminoacyl-tRNA hydrolase ArfB [Rhodospirillales bacterium]
MIPIGNGLVLDEREIEEVFIRAGGPGGQNVNKLSTAVQLRFDVRHSPSLPEAVRTRLERLAGRRLTEDGALVITARSQRTQAANRREALARLVDLVRRAAHAPRPRRPTRPSAAARAERLQAKSRRAEVKRLRSAPSFED